MAGFCHLGMALYIYIYIYIYISEGNNFIFISFLLSIVENNNGGLDLRIFKVWVLISSNWKLESQCQKPQKHEW
jgi:hypothetical protein